MAMSICHTLGIAEFVWPIPKIERDEEQLKQRDIAAQVNTINRGDHPIAILYPNPASGQVTFRCAVPGELHVFNRHGQEIDSRLTKAGETVLQLKAKYTPGIYSCR